MKARLAKIVPLLYQILRGKQGVGWESNMLQGLKICAF